VIVPTNNRPVLLRQTLESIRALEGPDLVFEILIGDNGNAPQTPVVAAEFGCVYFKTDKPGAGPARNLGLRAATSDYIAFSDDDDIWLPENIRPHLALLDARPELDAVIGKLIYTDENLKPLTGPMPAKSPGEGDDMLRAMLGEWFPQVGTTVMRMSARDRVGLFDEIYIHGEDVDWFLRLARQRHVGFIDTACLLFRGRPFGTLDQLNRDRAKAGRRVFLQHAIPEWRIWRSANEFLRGYRARLTYFYAYFSEAAKTRAKAKQYRQALVAMLDAAYVFPFRTLAGVIAPKPLRRIVGLTKRA
jgi:glycosyltransferase involved in cell wall biosynthesis